MSGFSAGWLALREGADHRARNGGLVERLGRYLAGQDEIRVVDLGCGTGSNLRALAPLLPPGQHWRLIDHDPELLEEADRQTKSWLGETGLSGVSVNFETADLSSGDLERILEKDCDLITAAALFDLVAESWIDRFAALITKRRVAFYSVLIYDGIMSWEPFHPVDEAIRTAFNVHQRGDKGFGPALGSDASRCLTEQLSRAGYQVTTASSPWLLTRDDLGLILATAEGIGQAALETGLVPAGDVANWLETRQELASCAIGHLDMLALPQ